MSKFVFLPALILPFALFAGENGAAFLPADKEELAQAKRVLPSEIAGFIEEAKSSGASHETAAKALDLQEKCKIKIKDAKTNDEKTQVLRCTRTSWGIAIRVFMAAKDVGVRESIMKEWNNGIEAKDKNVLLVQIAALGDVWEPCFLTKRLQYIFQTENDHEIISGLVYAIYEHGSKTEMMLLRQKWATKLDMENGKIISNGINWLKYRLESPQDLHGPASAPPGAVTTKYVEVIAQPPVLKEIEEKGTAAPPAPPEKPAEAPKKE